MSAGSKNEMMIRVTNGHSVEPPFEHSNIGAVVRSLCQNMDNFVPPTLLYVFHFYLLSISESLDPSI